MMSAERGENKDVSVWRFVGKPVPFFQSWRFIGVLFVLSTWLGTYAFSTSTSGGIPADRRVLDNLYLALQLFILASGAVDNADTTMQIARFLAPAVLGWATVVALARGLQQRLVGFQLALFYNRHTVLCGLGETGSQLLSDLRAKGRKVVVIEKESDNPNIQDALYQGVIVLVGDASRKDLLRVARISRAEIVYAVTGSDLTNLQIASVAKAIPAHREEKGSTIGGRGDLRLCYTHLRRGEFTQVLEDINKSDSARGMVATEFDVYKSGMQRILDEIWVGHEENDVRYCGDNERLEEILRQELSGEGAAKDTDQSSDLKIANIFAAPKSGAVLVFGPESHEGGTDERVIADAIKIRQQGDAALEVFACIWQEPRLLDADGGVRVRRITGTSVETVESEGLKNIKFESTQSPIAVRRPIELGLRSHHDGIREAAIEKLAEWLKVGKPPGAKAVIESAQNELLRYLDFLNFRGAISLLREKRSEIRFRAGALFDMLLHAHQMQPELFDDFRGIAISRWKAKMWRGSAQPLLRGAISVGVSTVLRKTYREKGATPCQYIEMLYALEHHSNCIAEIAEVYSKPFDQVTFETIVKLAGVANGLTSWLVYSYLAQWLMQGIQRDSGQTEHRLNEIDKILASDAQPSTVGDSAPSNGQDWATIRYVIHNALKVIVSLRGGKSANARVAVSLRQSLERRIQKREWHILYARPRLTGIAVKGMSEEKKKRLINEADCRDSLAVKRYLGNAGRKVKRPYWITTFADHTEFEYDTLDLIDYILGRSDGEDVVDKLKSVAIAEETEGNLSAVADVIYAFGNALPRLEIDPRAAMLTGLVEIFQNLKHCETNFSYHGDEVTIDRCMTKCLGRLRVANRRMVDAVLRSAMVESRGNLSRIVGEVQRWGAEEAKENRVSSKGDYLYQKLLAEEQARGAFARGMSRSSKATTVWGLFYSYCEEVQKALVA
jgi:hypothetical protein